MNKGFKATMFVATFFLIVFDLYILYKSAGTGGETTFKNIMLYLSPCALLTSICALLSYFKKELALKITAGVSLVVNASFLLLTFISVVITISNFDKMAEVYYESYLELFQFIGYGVLLVANIFLMGYVFLKGLKIPAFVFLGIASGVLVVDWVLMIMSNIDFFKANGGTGIWAAVVAGLNLDVNFDMLIRIISLVCYLAVYGVITKQLYSKSERQNG